MAEKPIYLAAFDSEDDGKGNPFLFCIVHEKGTYHCKTGNQCLRFFERLRDKVYPLKLQIWALNLEYDAVNLWGDRISECSLKFGRTALYGVKWEKIDFRDTLRHIPASAAKLGELVGLPKMHRDNSIAYCMRDAQIVYRAAKFIRNSYNEFEVNAKLTLPATSYKIWLDKFWAKNVFAPPDEIIESAQHAYYGGRTEAFSLGRFHNVKMLDVASMYPWAMTAGKFPIPWSNFKRISPKDEIKPLGLYRVRVKSDIYPGILPHRSKSGLDFPIGTWEGWYIGEELLAAKELGVSIKVLSGYTFIEEADPFTDYISRMFALKQSSRGPAREMYKLLGNSLYGKFGQKGENVRAMPLGEFLDRKGKRPENYRIWLGLAIWTETKKPPPWGNFIWAAIVTARARVKLRLEMRNLMLNGCRILYCDTDSILYSGDVSSYTVKARSIGDFELRGEYSECFLVGKKEYGLCTSSGVWEFHCKGVPYSEREKYLTTGKARYSLPYKIRGSARSGEKANVWREVEKERKSNLGLKRGLGPDNSLLPLIVSE